MLTHTEIIRFGANLKFNNTMKDIYIPVCTVLLLFFAGCSNDYLEVDQTESISTKDIALFNNDAGAATFVTAIYNKFLDFNMSTFSWNGMTSMASDDAPIRVVTRGHQ
jgi:hypothetical protein